VQEQSERRTVFAEWEYLPQVRCNDSQIVTQGRSLPLPAITTLVGSRILQCWFVPQPRTRACWCASVAYLPLRFKLSQTLPRCREHCLIHRCSRDCGILGQTRFGYGHRSREGPSRKYVLRSRQSRRSSALSAGTIALEISSRNARVAALQTRWDRLRAGLDLILDQRGADMDVLVEPGPSRQGNANQPG